MNKLDFIPGLIVGAISVIALEVSEDDGCWARLFIEKPWPMLFIGFPAFMGIFTAMATGIGETLRIIFVRRLLQRKGEFAQWLLEEKTESSRELLSWRKEEAGNGILTGMKFGGGVTAGMMAAMLTIALFK